MQKRIAFFVHDGSGLGHLRRCARIAAALQGPCACLIVTGHRSASWIVPAECEFLYLPSWDSFFATRSERWHRAPWLQLPFADAVTLRRNLLRDALHAFSLDAIVVDYLPLGLHRELEDFLTTFTGKKYFVLRGIIDSEDRTEFDEEWFGILARLFDRVFVTSDRRIVDVGDEYRLPNDVATKLSYTGYVCPTERETELRSSTHSSTSAWVVCSGGGGFGAERLIADCVDLARVFEDVQFEVVLGPRTTLTDNNLPSNALGRCRVWRERDDLAALHATANVVITNGGYNSIVEAASGGARLVVRAEPGPADERWQHARRLAAWYPVQLVEDRAALEPAVRHVLTAVATANRPRFPLDRNGTQNIRRIILEDLGVDA